MLALSVTCDRFSDKPIAIAAHIWSGYELMFLADDLSWLDKRRIQLRQTSSATESLRLLREGSVDGAALTLDEVLRARRDGLMLTIVMVFDISAGADALVATPDIRQLSDLKGRRVGYEPGAVGEWMLVNILQKSGLNHDDVQRVPLTFDQHEHAFGRQVDAVVTYEPVVSRLMDRNALKLFDSREIPDTIVDVLALRSDRMPAMNQHTIRQLIDAVFRARQHLALNSADSAYRMARRFGLPADRVLSSFRGLVLPDADYNERLLGGEQPVLRQRAANLAASLPSTNRSAIIDDFDELMTSAYLPDVSW